MSVAPLARGRMRVLLVDDDPHLRRIGALCLGELGGFEVHEAKDGDEAVSMAAGMLFDAIVLDVMMPRQDGPATLARIRRETPNRETPVVFVTANVRPSEIQKYLALGIKGVIRKPFDPMAMAEQVRALVSA